jgi:hypothetical protein
MSDATVTKSAAAKKGVQVHATIDQELHTKLEDHRWTVRLNMVDVVKLALTQYAEREGLLTEGAEAAQPIEKTAPAVSEKGSASPKA